MNGVILVTVVWVLKAVVNVLKLLIEVTLVMLCLSRSSECLTLSCSLLCESSVGFEWTELGRRDGVDSWCDPHSVWSVDGVYVRTLVVVGECDGPTSEGPVGRGCGYVTCLLFLLVAY